MNSRYLRRENENDLDYAMRLIKIKKGERPDDLDWGDITELLNLDLNKDSLRKSQDTEFGGIAVYEKMKKLIADSEPIEYQKELEVGLQELKKERIKLSDERAALNRRLREEARKESLKDIVYDCADILCREVDFRVDRNFIKTENSDRAAILTLSDMHFGIETNEFNNVYNEEVFYRRLVKLLNKTIEYIELNNISTTYVLGLGDYINGLIHTTTRIENKENVVNQVIKISEYLCNFLMELAQYTEIFYYDVSDNHGRVTPNKEQSVDLENFSIFIKWYLEARFRDHDGVHICENDVNEEIGIIDVLGHTYGFVHGHKDKIASVVQNLSLMTKKFFTAVFIGHSHHFEANETHGTYIYMNGTFSGNDRYSNNLRLTSNPSQNLFIVNNEGIECQYLIKL